MLFRQLDSVPTQAMDIPGMTGVAAKVILEAADGLPEFLVRMFEVEPSGSTGLHHHPQQHLFYFMTGKGHVVGNDGQKQPVISGDLVFTAPDEFHQVVNDDTENVLRWFDVVGPFGSQITAETT